MYEPDSARPVAEDNSPVDKPKHVPFLLRPGFYLPFGLAMLYGLVMRLSFGASSALSTLTFGFLFFVPVALGAIVVFVFWRTFRVTWFQALTLPWLSAFIFLCGVALVNIEVALCLIMASPLFLTASSVGGVVMNALLRLVELHPRFRQPTQGLLVMLLIAPYLLTSFETHTFAPDIYRTVQTSIAVIASPSTIWQHIIRVAEIQPHERQPRLSHWMGIPYPVEARLDNEGVGQVRYGSFANGLRFIETITAWEPERYIRFDVEIDADVPLPAPFDVLGDAGPFDVVAAAYRLEPLEDGRIRLHLDSTYRISTHINAYAVLWADAILSDFQMVVLEIVKARCEAAANL